jgi:hypothetical protein
MDDVVNAWVDESIDKIYIKMIDGTIKSRHNGENLFSEFKEVKKISDLRSYMTKNGITNSHLSKQIGMSPPSICNLFVNRKITEHMETMIRKKHPMALSNYDNMYTNPLIL